MKKSHTPSDVTIFPESRSYLEYLEKIPFRLDTSDSNSVNSSSDRTLSSDPTLEEQAVIALFLYHKAQKTLPSNFYSNTQTSQQSIHQNAWYLSGLLEGVK
jgi:hypothetical protein